MGRALAVAVLAAVLWTAAAWAATGGAAGMENHNRPTLRQLVGEETYRAAGLEALNPDQQEALARWLQDHDKGLLETCRENCRRHGPQGPPPWKP